MPITMACIGVYKGENDHLYIGIMAVGIMASLCTKNFKIDLKAFSSKYLANILVNQKGEVV